mgnify:CR=1 FL=1
MEKELADQKRKEQAEGYSQDLPQTAQVLVTNTGEKVLQTSQPNPQKQKVLQALKNRN